MVQRLGAIQITRLSPLLFYVCLTSINFLWTVVGVSHHFQSLNLLTQERCDDPIVFGDHDYKQHNELLEVMVKEGCVKGLFSDGLLTVRGYHWCPLSMPNSISCMGERILRPSDCKLLILTQNSGIWITQDPRWQNRGRIVNLLFGWLTGRREWFLFSLPPK